MGGSPVPSPALAAGGGGGRQPSEGAGPLGMRRQVPFISSALFVGRVPLLSLNCPAAGRLEGQLWPSAAATAGSLRHVSVGLGVGAGREQWREMFDGSCNNR